MNLTNNLLKLGIKHKVEFIVGESLIPRARNYLVEYFLQDKNDYTHFLFIDGDIQFKTEDVLKLLSHSDPDKNKNIVCGAYPKKEISWEKVCEAVDKGYGEKDPNNIKNFIGSYVINLIKNKKQSAKNDLIEVSESGTGFMMISKKHFLNYADKYPQLKYRPDHLRNSGVSGEKEITAFFMDVIEEGNIGDGYKRHLSEDYMFCKYSRNIGEKIWVDPTIKLNHIGNYVYEGNLKSLLENNMTVTVDTKKIKKI